VLQLAVEDIRDCFLAAMGMVGKALALLDLGVVEHEEGWEVFEQVGPDRAVDAGADAFVGLDCGYHFGDFARGERGEA